MTDDNRLPPRKHTFQKTQTLLKDFFSVDEYRGEFEKFDNTMSSPQRLLVFERGDSVAALLYDAMHREVIVVEQFRLPTAGTGHGWILEPSAGMIRGAETPRDCMMRELREETGFQVNNLIPISTFYVSPGGSSERIHLFYAEVRRVEKLDEGGGVKEDGENIRNVHIPLAEFFAMLRNNEFEDAKLIVAAQWLRERRSTMPPDDAEFADPIERVVKLNTPAAGGRKSARERKIIGFMKGDILNVRTVDVWVNSLSTDMLLDRFTDRTVSAAIRRHGAKKYPNTGQIMRDTIGEELAREMDGRCFVNPAKVIDTSSGELANSHNVQRIYHVASTRGEIGELLSTDLATIDMCMDNILGAIEARRRYRSVLIPMLGTGASGFPVSAVAPRLLRRAADFFQRTPNAKLQKIYFLAYSEIDAGMLAEATKNNENLFEPIAAGAAT